MASNCPYCGHNAHSTPMYMTCEESSLCQQCGLSESDAWLRRQEDELVARFSTYTISPQVEQQVPTSDTKLNINRIHFASAAAHSFPVTPYKSNDHQNTSTMTNEVTRVAETDPKIYNSQPVFPPVPLSSFDMQMDCDLEISDAATVTTDSKRSSVDAGSSSQSHTTDSLDYEISQAEPYMSHGYDSDRFGYGYDRNPLRNARHPEESSTRSHYVPCKDPVYNSRSWWEYGGESSEYRWDYLRERAM